MKKNKAKPPDPSVSQAAGVMGRGRWKDVPKAERSRIMAKVGKLGGKAKRSKNRCFCGEFTMRRAASRSFDCCRRNGVLVVNRPASAS